MKIKPNYIIIPAIVILTSVAGSLFTADSIGTWYTTIVRPDWNPPNWIFGPVWTTIYTLSAISALLVWNKAPKKKKKQRNTTMWLFAFNAFMNASWSYIFFNRQDLYSAVLVAGVLALSVLLIMIYAYKINKLASWLLLPYVLWVTFATYLSYTIYTLNM